MSDDPMTHLIKRMRVYPALLQMPSQLQRQRRRHDALVPNNNHEIHQRAQALLARPAVRCGEIVEEHQRRHIRRKAHGRVCKQEMQIAQGVDDGEYGLGRREQSGGRVLRRAGRRRGAPCADEADPVDADACGVQCQVDEDGVVPDQVLRTAQAVGQRHEQYREAVVEVLLAPPELAPLRACCVAVVVWIPREAVLETRVE